MRFVRYLLLPVMAAIICSIGPVRAGAQALPGLSASPAAGQGVFDSAPIIIDGAPVVRIAALASPPPGATPLATRIFLIDSAIAQILATNPDSNMTVYNPATFKVSVEKEGSEYALVATDAKHPAPLPILTVTAEDARRLNQTPQVLAAQWQAQVQTALVAALERRQPAAIHRSTTLITRGAIALLVLTLLGLLVVRMLRNRNVAAVLSWALVLIWVGAVTYGLLLFPQTVTYGHWIIHAVVRVAFVWIAALIVDRLLSVAVHEGIRAYARFGVPAGAQARSLLRVPTMSKALGGFKRFIVFFVAALVTLSTLQIPIASVVTIGGIAALAIGFAAQSLVRDFLNGLLVLFEDQYVVGDYIAIGLFNGVVEQLTLRVVQIRDSQGNLITIPHSSVTQVVNSSRNWSRIDYKVSLDPAADLRKGIEVLRTTLDALKSDADWKDAVIEPYEWIGVESVSHSSLVLRAVIRTAPLRQFDLRREINLRLHDAFASAGIALGVDAALAFSTPSNASPDPT